MRIHNAIVFTIVATLLVACEEQKPAAAIDPMTGVECFEAYRASLPPGTQYEGVDKVTGDRITIKIMNGVDVVTMECRINPDGSVGQLGSEHP
ncbi:MAG TPA: hypothetical protein VM011_06410 [Gammaproteobacteria bacterium]|nr:hypothetical protein [Gammaproteobacteria bacterium]